MGAELTSVAHQAPPRTVTLDAEALARLGELDPDGRRGVVHRVLVAFESALSRVLTQLEAMRDAPDLGALGMVTHNFKSSATSVGALALAQICNDIDRRRRDGETGDVAEDIVALLATGHATLAAVRAMLQD